jgi:hypothetical protein
MNRASLPGAWAKLRTVSAINSNSAYDSETKANRLPGTSLP